MNVEKEKSSLHDEHNEWTSGGVRSLVYLPPVCLNLKKPRGKKKKEKKSVLLFQGVIYLHKDKGEGGLLGAINLHFAFIASSSALSAAFTVFKTTLYQRTGILSFLFFYPHVF